MPIDIKEIFKSDLDPNSNLWWSKDKTDKINHNFKQLISGGMVGPMGAQGSFGISGYMGAQGLEGSQGPLGDQGSQGAIGESTWVIAEGTVSNPIATRADHIFPSKQQPIEYAPSTMRVGKSPIGEQPESYYGDVLSIHSPATGAPYTDRVNLKLTTYSLDDSGRMTNNLVNSEHRLFKDSGLLIYEEGRIRNGNPNFIREVKINSGDTYYLYNPANQTLNSTIELTTQDIRIKNKLKFNKDVYANADLSYNPTSVDVSDRVLVSTDSSGKVKWEPKNSVIPGYLPGMIISIPEWAFNGNFETQNSYTQEGNEAIRFEFGRGLIGSQYEGWYICNGKKWNTSNGINEFLVPNMHLVELDVNTSSGNQPVVSEVENSSIMGGWPTTMTAEYLAGGKYNVELNPTYTIPDINNKGETFIIKDNTHGEFKVSKMIHIVKLPFKSLAWEETTAAPVTLTNITLTEGGDGLSDWEDACTGGTNSYKWSGPANFSYWATFTSQYKLYNSVGNAYAPSGWYGMSGQGVRWWDQDDEEFKDPNDPTYGHRNCPTWSPITLIYNAAVSGVNDNVFAQYSIGIEMNNANWENATAIRINLNGTITQPSAGWWRSAQNNVLKSRRYWDGTQFLGESIIESYVDEISTSNTVYRVVKAAGASNACSIASTHLDTRIYVARNNAPTGWLDVGSISSTEPITFYAPVGWIPSGSTGEEPLVKIKNQTAPGYSNPSDTITHIVDGGMSVGSPPTFIQDSQLAITISSGPGGGDDC